MASEKDQALIDAHSRKDWPKLHAACDAFAKKRIKALGYAVGQSKADRDDLLQATRAKVAPLLPAWNPSAGPLFTFIRKPVDGALTDAVNGRNVVPKAPHVVETGQGQSTQAKLDRYGAEISEQDDLGSASTASELLTEDSSKLAHKRYLAAKEALVRFILIGLPASSLAGDFYVADVREMSPAQERKERETRRFWSRGAARGSYTGKKIYDVFTRKAAGATEKEIARALGMSEGAVKTAMQYATQRLKEVQAKDAQWMENAAEIHKELPRVIHAAEARQREKMQLIAAGAPKPAIRRTTKARATEQSRQLALPDDVERRLSKVVDYSTSTVEPAVLVWRDGKIQKGKPGDAGELSTQFVDVTVQEALEKTDP